MESAPQLAGRLKEVLLNGKWIANTNFRDQIESVTWEQATQKVADLNTIALLTYHINYYLGGVLQVLQGGQLTIQDKYSFDMPPVQTEKDWEKMKTDFIANSEAFISEVEKLTETQLEASFVDERYGSYRRNMEGLIEHTYYHLGQVSLIRKLITAA